MPSRKRPLKYAMRAKGRKYQGNIDLWAQQQVGAAKQRKKPKTKDVMSAWGQVTGAALRGTRRGLRKY